MNVIIFTTVILPPIDMSSCRCRTTILIQKSQPHPKERGPLPPIFDVYHNMLIPPTKLCKIIIHRQKQRQLFVKATDAALRYLIKLQPLE